uniref:3-ketoacyl-CoA synthase 5-like n=1 Tax=Erigeron canadensis TaxID=72917 RepID=UPI001CB904B1|nr:3-ketoacyl-CoA synthase 5-like [Erigeron canadensis]
MFKFAKESHMYLILTLVTISFFLHDLLMSILVSNYNISIFILIITILAFYFVTKPRTVYLLDFACFKPPPMYRIPYATAYEHGHILLAKLQPESYAFQAKIFERAGLGEETSCPGALHYLPPNPSLKDAREETELVIFSALDSLFKQTKISPEDIDILILNCSLFITTPSLSAMVIHKYKMRSNVKSYNLSGMGCSAGLISIDLAKHLLQVHPESYALVISTEIITPNSYMGKERSMLLPNCLFRMGGATVLLTNKKSVRKHAKYSLLHVVRTHKGADDKSYGCVTQEEDEEGHVGISLNLDLMVIAAKTLKLNISILGSLVLPLSEKLHFLLNLVERKIFKLKKKPYIPDFKKAFDHYCIHAGGRAVIDEIQKSLKLTAEHVEASKMTLYRWGNTSSSSLWYELGYIEAKGRMEKGDKVWQIGFGSGFKCNSVVWKCNRDIDEIPKTGAWADCIHKYPVCVPEVVKI